MASREGPRAAGTDGNDFQHREIIKEQYYISARTKSRLRWCLLLHASLATLLLVKLAPNVLVSIDIDLAPIFKRLQLPPMFTFELMWLVCVAGAYAALIACRRSSLVLMKVFVVVTIVFGILPILIGVAVFADDFVILMNTADNNEVRQEIKTYLGYPLALLYLIFFVVAIQMHLFQLYFASVLIKAWQPKKKRG